MKSINSHMTNCDNMFLNYDNGINKIRQMTTDTTANCVEAEKENERASTLSNVVGQDDHPLQGCP